MLYINLSACRGEETGEIKIELELEEIFELLKRNRS